jgi:hypothetical protein
MHKVYGDRTEKVMERLENDIQKIIYMDWVTCGYIWNGNDRAKRYMHVSDHDWDIAYGNIMDTISLGMG